MSVRMVHNKRGPLCSHDRVVSSFADAAVCPSLRHLPQQDPCFVAAVRAGGQGPSVWRCVLVTYIIAMHDDVCLRCRVDFGDFSWFRLEPIINGRLVGGFGRIKTVSAACLP